MRSTYPNHVHTDERVLFGCTKCADPWTTSSHYRSHPKDFFGYRSFFAALRGQHFGGRHRSKHRRRANRYGSCFNFRRIRNVDDRSRDLWTNGVCCHPNKMGTRSTDGVGRTSTCHSHVLGRQALPMVLSGAVLGVIGGLMCTPLMRSVLYDVSPSDWRSFISAVFFVLMVVTVGLAVPLARAVTIQPAEALRTRP